VDSYNVDDEGIARNVFRVDVVIAAEQEYHLGRWCCRLEVETELKCVDLALVSVENVVAIPSVLWVDELVVVCEFLWGIENGLGINSRECIMADDQQWQFSSLQFLANRVISSVDIIKHSCAIAKMSVTISEISWCTNAVNLSLLVDSLKNTRVEHWCFSSGVDSNQQNEISVFNVLDLRVEEVIRPEVVAEGEVVVLAELIVEAV
jgi:hypothetical protein